MLRKLNRTSVFFVVLVIFFVTTFYRRKSFQSISPSIKYDLPVESLSTRKRSFESLVLSQKQCAEAFPGFDDEIKRAIARGQFDLRRLRDDTPGLVQGRIKNGKRISSILHSLHRAIITSLDPVPDTIFALTINDIPQSNAWSFARSDDSLTPDTPWLMPHYSSWSWPIESLGPLDEALGRIEQVEKVTKWDNKLDSAVWRGTPWFGPDWRPGLRLMLLEVAKGQEWADVESWSEGQNNTLSIEGFCRYKYIIYAEGKSYSGRLPYHQACASIILTPPPTFLLHNTHLLRPVFSSLLPLPLTPRPPAHPRRLTTPSLESYPLPNTSISWPLSYPPDEANIIFIQPDWADVDLVVDYLRENPTIAEGIARRQRKLWVEEGYLSAGAEACYWRSLIKAWSDMVKVTDGSEWGEGMRWETFSLLGRLSYDAVFA